MAFESIPLNWEMLSLVGGASATAAGAAWKTCQMLGRVHLRELEAKLAFYAHRADTESSEVDRHKLVVDQLQVRTVEQQQLIAKLKADLKNRLPEDGARTIDELSARVKNFDQLRKALLGDEGEVWKLQRTNAPPNFLERMKKSRPTIVTVINYKGGVGKTTLVAGLAAYFAKRGKRVLIIDFDYQGSLTRMMILGARLTLGSSIRADKVIGGEMDGDGLVQHGRDLSGTLPGANLITCGQSFDGFEYRAMLRWLLGETEDDVRFRLAKLLLSPEVQKEYDYVLIDAPPRASTGAINALCASHAVLVPTVLDALAVDAAGSFLARTNNTLRPLNPALEFAGIVCTLTVANNLNDVERSALDDARRSLELWEGPRHLFESRIRHFVALSRAAGSDIGYLTDRNVRKAFDALGDELLEQLLTLGRVR